MVSSSLPRATASASRATGWPSPSKTLARWGRSAGSDVCGPPCRGQGGRLSVRILAEQQLDAEPEERRALARAVGRLARPGVAADQLPVEPLAVQRTPVHGAGAVFAHADVGARAAAKEELIGERGPRADVLIEHRG